MSRSFHTKSKHRVVIYQTRERVFHLIFKYREVLQQTLEGVSGIQTPRNDTKTGGVFHMTLKH